MAKKNKNPEPCPCGSGKSFDSCCGIYINEKMDTLTAEALMRSRYTAYCLGREDYLLATWHSTTRPLALNLKEDTAVKWLRLKVERVEKGGEQDEEGIVGFSAFYKNNGKAEKLHETSRFVRENGKWVYLDAL